MNRINALGMDLLEYKKELLKPYPELVLKSLHLSINTMAESSVIDANTYDMIRQDVVAYQEFESYIKGRQVFMKTEEELLQEFKLLKNRILVAFEESNVNGLHSIVSVKEETVSVMKRYVVDETFLRRYFHVDEKGALELLKARGFAEQFSVLRLNAIFQPFLAKKKQDMQELPFDLSFVYFDPESGGYAIDLTFKFSESNIENELWMNEYIPKITDVILDSEKLFEEYTK